MGVEMLKFLLSPLRGLGKKLGCWAIQKEGGILRGKVKDALTAQGPAAIDKLFDASQAKLEQAVLKLPFLSDGVKASINGVIEAEGNALQDRLKTSAVQGGTAAIDHAFDLFIAAAVEKIQQL